MRDDCCVSSYQNIPSLTLLLTLTSFSFHFETIKTRIKKLQTASSTHRLAHVRCPGLTNTVSAPQTIHFGVPFVYHHIVHLIVLLYMVLLPFANVFVQEGIPSYWTLITYPAVSFVLFGVLEAADAMADPYGEDECDFNLNA